MSITITLPDDFRQKLNDHPGHSLGIQDANDNRIYLVTALTNEDMERKKINQGIDEAERGEVEAFDFDAMLGKFHKAYRQRNTTS